MSLNKKSLAISILFILILITGCTKQVDESENRTYNDTPSIKAAAKNLDESLKYQEKLLEAQEYIKSVTNDFNLIINMNKDEYNLWYAKNIVIIRDFSKYFEESKDGKKVSDTFKNLDDKLTIAYNEHNKIKPNESTESTISNTALKLGPDADGNCTLLTIEDIKNVCGVDTTAEIQEPRTEDVCSTRFVKDGTKYADRIYQSVTIRYNTDYDPDTDDVNTMIKNLVDRLDAERLSNNAVFVPPSGDWSVIYGTKYKIIVQNTIPTSPNIICKPEQIKELGILVSERIYG